MRLPPSFQMHHWPGYSDDALTVRRSPPASSVIFPVYEGFFGVVVTCPLSLFRATGPNSLLFVYSHMLVDSAGFSPTLLWRPGWKEDGGISGKDRYSVFRDGMVRSLLREILK